MSKF
ncbi:hypothetical protein Taro_014721 [Colocasia esculenta]|jgi:hypothetical protein